MLYVKCFHNIIIISLQVDELMFDYTMCSKSAPSSINDASAATGVQAPIQKWAYDQSSKVCTIEFRVEKTFVAPVFLYYRLTNFYQNHRRYVRSFSVSQLSGSDLAESDLSTDCSPLTANSAGQVYYPCGLIANSLFNDTIGTQNNDFSAFTIVDSDSNNYQFSTKGIAWTTDAERYKASTYDMSKVVPPMNWKTYRGKQLNGTWKQSGITFNPADDEHFQVIRLLYDIDSNTFGLRSG